MSSNSVGFTETNNYICLEDLNQTYGMRVANSLNLFYCGKEDCIPEWTFGPYVRENFVIHVVKGGYGTYKVNDREYRLSAGDVFVIYPGIETTYYADAEQPWSYMWVGFNGARAKSIVEEIGFTEDEPVLSIEDTSEISKAIDFMLAANELDNVNALKRTAALYGVMALIMEQTVKNKPDRKVSEVRYVNKAVDIISESYAKKVRIAEIAAVVGINRSYLTSIFKREMHMSPQEFLISFRLEKAAQLLRETDDPVGSIASAVGYTDPLTFSKAFRKKYGEAPSEYRKSRPELDRVDVRGGYTGFFNL